MPGESAQRVAGSREDARIAQEIRQVFKKHRGRYGSPRIHRDLRDEGIPCSRKRVARLMREEELSALRKRRRVTTTKSDKTHSAAPNILDREFHAEGPNSKWVTDTAVYSDSARLALLSSDLRSVFKNGGRMVDVGEL